MKLGQRIQVSQPRQPCWKLSRRWRIKDLALQVQQTGRTGWYFRVLKAGYVESNLSLILVETFRSGLLPELITSCTTSSMTESWLLS